MSRLAAVTAAGAVLCLLAAAAPVLALYVPGLALLLVAGACRGLAVLPGSRARVSVLVARRTVVCGEQVVVRVGVSRAGWLFGPLCACAGAGPAVSFAAGEREASVPLVAEGRGVQPLGPVSVWFADPLGLCRRRVLAPAGKLLVLPHVEELDHERLLAISSPAATPAPWGDLLRRYRPGAPLSRIHWPAVARSGELYERAAGAPERTAGPVVVLDGRAPVAEQAFERAVAATASLCAALAPAGAAGWCCRESAPLACTPASWPGLHERLALVQPGAAPAGDRAEGVVFVTGSPQPGAEAFASYVVDASGQDPGEGLFSLCGCAVRAPGRLQAA